MKQSSVLPTMILMVLALAASICSSQGVTADGQREKAIALELQGNNIEAENAWHGFLNTHPENAEAYAHLGLLEARQERYFAGGASLSQGVGFEPEDGRPKVEPWAFAI